MPRVPIRFASDNSDDLEDGSDSVLLRMVSSEYITRRKDALDNNKKTAPQSTNRRQTFRTDSKNKITTASGLSIDGLGGLLGLGQGPNNKFAQIQDDYDVHGVKGSNSKSKAMSKMSVHSANPTTNSWELWWIQSPMWKRKLVFVLIILIIFALIQFFASGFFVYRYITYKRPDPYVCRTANCRELALWAISSRNVSVNPCENMHNYVCDNYDKTDQGSLYEHWFKNFARMESYGKNLLSDILKKSHDPMALQIIKFYQVCMESHLVADKNINLKNHFRLLMDYVFEDFNANGLVDEDGKKIEDVATNMVKLFGDYGLFQVWPPVDYPSVLLTKFQYTGAFTDLNQPYFQPILETIYDRHNIPKTPCAVTTSICRDKLTIFVRNMGGLIDRFYLKSKNGGIHDCKDKPPNKAIEYLNLYFPFYFAYFNLTKDDMKEVPGEDPVWQSKNGEILNLKPDPIRGRSEYRAFQNMKVCWNEYFYDDVININKTTTAENIKYIKSAYAVFFSFRLLIELVHDVGDDVAKFHQLDQPKHSFFRIFQKNYYEERRATRCFKSLLDAMGHYPAFRYFHDRNPAEYRNKIYSVVKESAEALWKQFRPVEEGGLRFVSSRIRERAQRLLDPNNYDISITIPSHDDDDKADEWLAEAVALGVTDDHLTNIIRWREFMVKRTIHYWKQHTQKGKLVWHRNFYIVDTSEIFEAPTATSSKTAIIKFPISIFANPYFLNDLAMADYTGARVMIIKSWLSLLEHDYAKLNILGNKEINNDGDIIYHEKRHFLYREGILSDGGFEPCEALTYDWVFPYAANQKRHTNHHLVQLDPHEIAFRQTNYDLDGNNRYRYEKQNAIFQTAIGARTTYKWYFDRVKKLKTVPHWQMTHEEKAFTKYRKLIGHEHFSEQQLFFLLYFRQVCRAHHPHMNRNNLINYYSYTTENLVGIMHTKEFAEAFHCPRGTPMNPLYQCFL